MHTAVLDVLPPEEVDFCLEAALFASAPSRRVLVVVKAALLLVYAIQRPCCGAAPPIDGGGGAAAGPDRPALHLLSRHPFPTPILDVKSIPFSAGLGGLGSIVAPHDVLMLAFGAGQFSIVRYDETVADFVTVSLHSLGSTPMASIAARSDAPEAAAMAVSAAAPKAMPSASSPIGRLIAVPAEAPFAFLHISKEQFAILPLGHLAPGKQGSTHAKEAAPHGRARAAASGGPLPHPQQQYRPASFVKAYSCIDERIAQVLQVAFLPGYMEPTLAILFETRPTFPTLLTSPLKFIDTVALAIVAISKASKAAECTFTVIARYDALPSDVRSFWCPPEVAATTGGGIIVDRHHSQSLSRGLKRRGEGPPSASSQVLRGIYLAGANELVHIDPGNPLAIGIALNSYASLTTRMPHLRRTGGSLQCTMEAARFFPFVRSPLPHSSALTGGLGSPAATTTLYIVADDGQWLQCRVLRDGGNRRIELLPAKDAVCEELRRFSLPYKAITSLSDHLTVAVPVSGDAFIVGNDEALAITREGATQVAGGARAESAMMVMDRGSNSHHGAADDSDDDLYNTSVTTVRAQSAVADAGAGGLPGHSNAGNASVSNTTGMHIIARLPSLGPITDFVVGGRSGASSSGPSNDAQDDNEAAPFPMSDYEIVTTGGRDSFGFMNIFKNHLPLLQPESLPQLSTTAAVKALFSLDGRGQFVGSATNASFACSLVHIPSSRSTEEVNACGDGGESAIGTLAEETAEPTVEERMVEDHTMAIIRDQPTIFAATSSTCGAIIQVTKGTIRIISKDGLQVVAEERLHGSSASRAATVSYRTSSGHGRQEDASSAVEPPSHAKEDVVCKETAIAIAVFHEDGSLSSYLHLSGKLYFLGGVLCAPSLRSTFLPIIAWDLSLLSVPAAALPVNSPPDGYQSVDPSLRAVLTVIQEDASGAKEAIGDLKPASITMYAFAEASEEEKSSLVTIFKCNHLALLPVLLSNAVEGGGVLSVEQEEAAPSLQPISTATPGAAGGIVKGTDIVDVSIISSHFGRTFVFISTRSLGIVIYEWRRAAHPLRGSILSVASKEGEARLGADFSMIRLPMAPYASSQCSFAMRRISLTKVSLLPSDHFGGQGSSSQMIVALSKDPGSWFISIDSHGWPRIHRVRIPRRQRIVILDGLFMYEPGAGSLLSRIVLDRRFTRDTDWPLMRAPLLLGKEGEVVRSVIYHQPSDAYVILTIVSISPFALPKDEYAPLSDNSQCILPPDALPPLQGRYKVCLVSGRTLTVIDEHLLKESECAISLLSAPLETKQTASGVKAFVVLGTSYSRGEDRPNRGRVLIFDVIDVVPDPATPERDRRLKMLVEEEMKGPVTAVSHLKGHLLVSLGPKVILHSFENNEALTGVAFVDAGVYNTTIVPLKSYFLLGDICKSLSFHAFQSKPSKVVTLGRDFEDRAIISADCLVLARPPPARGVIRGGSGRDQVAFAAADLAGSVHLYTYAPMSPKSDGGVRLIAIGSLAMGGEVFKVTRILLASASAAPSLVTALGGGEGHEAVVGAARTVKHGVLVGKRDGSIGCIVPLEEGTFRRLQGLQGKLTSLLPHPSGINPAAVRSGGATAAQRNVIDFGEGASSVASFVNLPRSAVDHIATRMLATTCAALKGAINEGASPLWRVFQ